MTEKQDELIYRNNRELHYSFDPEQGYTRKVDYQYPGNQVIIQQGWDVVESRVRDVSARIKEGKLSPLSYYMEKNQMELPMLSDYTGFMRWRIKRHLKPGVFSRLRPATLAKYASVFDVGVNELLNPPLT
ncbi:MAG: hypothetical protein NTU51_04865 [Bacteroidetes bacterium]|nr:hypothetical protein [Bacteroidota bacterium]